MDETNDRPEMVPPTDLAALARAMASAFERLHEDADALRAEMAAYREEFQATDATAKRAERRSGRTILVGTIIVIVLAVGLVVAGITAHGNTGVIAEIRGCTEPGHDCYDQNQARSQQTVGPIVGLICLAIPPERRPMPPCPRT